MKLLLYIGIESVDLCYIYSKIFVVWREFIFGIYIFNGGLSLCLKKLWSILYGWFEKIYNIEKFLMII